MNITENIVGVSDGRPGVGALRPLLKRYESLRENGYDHVAAFEAARRFEETRSRATVLGLTVTWEDEPFPWDTQDRDGEPPPIWACARVDHPTAPDDRSWVPSRRRNTSRQRGCLASLGGISLCSWADPYVMEVEADLLEDAMAELAGERDRAATVEAAEVAERATYAGPPQDA